MSATVNPQNLRLAARRQQSGAAPIVAPAFAQYGAVTPAPEGEGGDTPAGVSKVSHLRQVLSASQRQNTSLHNAVVRLEELLASLTGAGEAPSPTAAIVRPAAQSLLAEVEDTITLREGLIDRLHAAADRLSAAVG